MRIIIAFWLPNLRETFFDDVSTHKSLKCRQIRYKMIFWPELAEDISSVYLLDQKFEYDSDKNKIKKNTRERIYDLYPPIIVFVCISSCSID